MKYKKIKYINYLLGLVLLLVTPLYAYAKNGDQIIEPTMISFKSQGEDSFIDLSFDYWSIDEKAYPKSQDQLISLSEKYEKMPKDAIERELGSSKKTDKTVASANGHARLSIELKPGIYLLKLDDESFDKLKSYYIPAFFLKVGSSNELSITSKAIDKSIGLYKTDKSDKSPIEGVEFELYEFEGSRDKAVKKSVSYKDGIYQIAPSGTYTLKTDHMGRIRVQGLSRYKKYFFKETRAQNGYVFENLTSKDLTYGMIANLVNEKEAKGRFKFIKVDSKNSDIRLQGARFVLSKYDPEKKDYYVLKRGNDDYIVESNKSGDFLIEGLDFGKYRLQEIKAPEGYKLSSEPIDFEIGKNETEVTKARFIENEKKPKKKRLVKTGDIKMYISLISGLIFLTSGVILLKKERKNK